MLQFVIENHVVTTVLTTVFVCIPLYSISDVLAVYLWYKK